MSEQPIQPEESTGAKTASESISPEPAVPADPLLPPVLQSSIEAVRPADMPPVASTELPPPPAPTGPTAYPLRFHGQTDEFFRIWIVNTLLTILTLGVFFAWAKVRKRRYLRGNTELLGHRFDYRADPRRLLIGHGVVLVLFLGYALFGVVYPAVRFGVIALGIALLPWIVVRSLSFNAHNTVYRGLRFRFNPSLSGALKVYLLEWVLIILTLGIYFPAWERSKRHYVVSNHRLGDAYFHFEGSTGRFYSTFFLAGSIIFGAAMVGGVIIALMTRQYGQLTSFAQLIPFLVLYGFGFFVGRQLIFARLFNHVWNHTRVDEHRFRASLDTGRWLGLQLTNLVAIIASAGLLYPWALIRAQRTAASCLEFVPQGPIDGIQRMGSAGGSGTGDMAAEFIGLDFGL